MKLFLILIISTLLLNSSIVNSQTCSENPILGIFGDFAVQFKNQINDLNTENIDQILQNYKQQIPEFQEDLGVCKQFNDGESCCSNDFLNQIENVFLAYYNSFDQKNTKLFFILQELEKGVQTCQQQTNSLQYAQIHEQVQTFTQNQQKLKQQLLISQMRFFRGNMCGLCADPLLWSELYIQIDNQLKIVVNEESFNEYQEEVQNLTKQLQESYSEFSKYIESLQQILLNDKCDKLVVFIQELIQNQEQEISKVCRGVDNVFSDDCVKNIINQFVISFDDIVYEDDDIVYDGEEEDIQETEFFEGEDIQEENSKFDGEESEEKDESSQSNDQQDGEDGELQIFEGEVVKEDEQLNEEVIYDGEEQNQEDDRNNGQDGENGEDEQNGEIGIDREDKEDEQDGEDKEDQQDKEDEQDGENREDGVNGNDGEDKVDEQDGENIEDEQNLIEGKDKQDSEQKQDGEDGEYRDDGENHNEIEVEDDKEDGEINLIQKEGSRRILQENEQLKTVQLILSQQGGLNVYIANDITESIIIQNQESKNEKTEITKEIFDTLNRENNVNSQNQQDLVLDVIADEQGENLDNQSQKKVIEIESQSPLFTQIIILVVILGLLLVGYILLKKFRYNQLQNQISNAIDDFSDQRSSSKQQNIQDIESIDFEKNLSSSSKNKKLKKTQKHLNSKKTQKNTKMNKNDDSLELSLIPMERGLSYMSDSE